MSDQWGVSQPRRPGHGAGDLYDGAYAGAPYGEAGPRRTNGAALAGAILSVLPPLGLVISAVGLSRAKALGGAGRTAGGVGIVLSLVFAVGYGVGIYEVESATRVDPACASVLATESTLSSDESALTTLGLSGGDGGDGSGGGSGGSSGSDGGSGSAEDAQGVLGTMASELQTLRSELAADAARAAQADIRARVQAVDDDLGRMIVDVKAVEGGDEAALSGLEGAARQLQADGGAMDDACGQGESVGQAGV